MADCKQTNDLKLAAGRPLFRALQCATEKWLGMLFWQKLLCSLFVQIACIHVATTVKSVINIINQSIINHSTINYSMQHTKLSMAKCHIHAYPFKPMEFSRAMQPITSHDNLHELDHEWTIDHQQNPRQGDEGELTQRHVHERHSDELRPPLDEVHRPGVRRSKPVDRGKGDESSNGHVTGKVTPEACQSVEGVEPHPVRNRGHNGVPSQEYSPANDTGLDMGSIIIYSTNCNWHSFVVEKKRKQSLQ